MKDLFQSIQKKMYQSPSSELIHVEECLMQQTFSGGGGAGNPGGGDDFDYGKEFEFEDDDLDFESRLTKLKDLTPFYEKYRERRTNTEE